MVKYQTLNSHFDIINFLEKADKKGYKIINFVTHRNELLVFFNDEPKKKIKTLPQTESKELK